jgi:hypothetical protein
MLRHATLILLTIAASSAAFGADQLAAPPAKRHLATPLPAGQPRPHYNHITTVVDGVPPPVGDADRDPDSLLSRMLPTTPMLAGSTTLPGIYGRRSDYDYQGPYYGGGGSYTGFFYRLPYACGVYGYC